MLDVEDICNTTPNPQTVIAYVAQYFNKFVVEASSEGERAPEGEEAGPVPNKKITLYLRFSNVKSLDSRCQVELQVRVSLQCDWPMDENA